MAKQQIKQGKALKESDNGLVGRMIKNSIIEPKNNGFIIKDSLIKSALMLGRSGRMW